MRHYGSPSMKKTMVISNNKLFWLLDKGPVPKRKREGLEQTTKRYKSADGKTRFVGTPRLKRSQTLHLELWNFLVWKCFDPNVFWEVMDLKLDLSLFLAFRGEETIAKDIPGTVCKEGLDAVVIYGHYFWTCDRWCSLDKKNSHGCFHQVKSKPKTIKEYNLWNPLVEYLSHTLPHNNPSQAGTTTQSLPQLFAAMPWSECVDAELSDVIRYLKKSKYLTVPEEWIPLM